MNLVQGIHQTVMKLIWGPKSFTQYVMGIFTQFNKSDGGVNTLLASEGMDLFVDLWEAQPCLWGPK